MALNQLERAAIRETVGEVPSDAAALTRLLAARYSCRAYKPDPVPRKVIDQMLGIAQMSASWCNSQPWQTIVTEGEGTERFRKALYDHAVADATSNAGVPSAEADFPFPTAYRGVYKERQREVGWQLYESVGIAFGDRAASGKQALENFRFFGAPHVLVITSERDLGVYGVLDCGVFLGSVMLAAEALGIGMIPQAALAIYAPMMREHFRIPDNRVIVVGASFGYADDSHPANSFRSRRAAVGDAVQYVAE